MQRITIAVDDELMTDIDKLIAMRGYQNRSEAFRDLMRAGLQQLTTGTSPDQESVAALIYVYDHAKRDLPKRLTDAFHDHHEMAISTLHVHLDAATCMEVTVLKGSDKAIRHFAEHLIAERGIRHGRLVVMPSAALNS